MSSEWEVVVDAGAVLGEGPHWDGERLWWVDIEGHLIHRTDVGDRSDEVIDVGEKVSSVIPRRGGGFVAGYPDGVGFHGADGRHETRLLIEESDAHSRMNDAKCDPLGRLYTGTMTQGGASSALYRVDHDLGVSTVVDGVGISNGLGWSPDGTRMYYIDTPTQRLDVFDYDPQRGRCENRRPLIDFSQRAGYPDGLTVDAEGCIWVALWTGWAVHRFDPEGGLMQQISLPVSKPTSCAFGGPDLDRLFITSASVELSDAELADQPLSGALFEVSPDCRGQPGVPFDG
ncbi:SMP-30/gluconolactonase/LRE family protein [Candidatus Poriferisocius sp.]|uniref:SMP-30/gluconolactonase/LRE family protein n=1 Tax=Candidatus Poriferisocius sp. TaxID=3101276 RepID=UPI003B028DEC